ncbi:hypothetical protein B0T17DRAFT_627292 [Bombardia bombarda]|uniref:DNA-directed RNA polymerase n=1 Tax=Bombardia bombarda TaxID=252184 RepID=A0AA39XNB3_9PEZI|nr:hypothetical protein B0T17DRAFT_627292 [Bombardia bombarda]
MLVRSAAARQSLPLPLHRLASTASPQLLSRCSSLGTQQQQPLPTSRRLLTTAQQLRPWKRKSFRALRSRPLIPPGVRLAHSRLFELQPYDPSSPLIIKDQDTVTNKERLNNNGIPGDLEDMLAIFDACVEVGRLDRAGLVLARLGRMRLLNGNEMVDLHNRYLQERLAQIFANPGIDNAEDMHKWFELQIHNKLPYNVETIAYMLKASLLSSRDSRLHRLVERYMGMLPKENALGSLFLGDVLSAKDMTVVAEICPELGLPEDDLEVWSNAEGSEDIPFSSEISPGNTRQFNTRPSETPQVLGVVQKGSGMDTLKQTLSLFSELPPDNDIASLSYEERRQIQSRLERDAIEAALARWRSDNENLQDMGLMGHVNSGGRLSGKLYDWHVALTAYLKAELNLIDEAEACTSKSREQMERCLYGPMLRQSTPKRLAAVTILSCMSALSMHGADRGVPISTAISQMAKIVEEDIRLQISERKAGARSYRKRNMQNMTPQIAMEQLRFAHREASKEAQQQESTRREGEAPALESRTSQNVVRPWSGNISAKVGAALLKALIETAKITVEREHPDTTEIVSQEQPAFTHSVQLRRGKKIGMLLPNKALSSLMQMEPKGDFLARHLPMVVEPEPWTGFEKGGFVESVASLVRVKQGDKDQRIYTEEAIHQGQMDQVLKGLDVLGKTAWRINREVFHVMLEAWNGGEAIAELPPLHPQVPIPEEPEPTADPLIKRAWMKQVKAAENIKSGIHSQRCFINFQLEIARAFRDQTFYFPHNIDFRGRAYPIPAYLNHMGADHVRGLMKFAKGKALGEQGLRWLKVHLANVYGYDKASLSEREKFATENVENIRDSVNNPLNGKGWWLQAEDPWQCLAACFELRAALDLPDPTSFVSQLPVHQDGTCNGLQHYAALGGDTWGAQQVNLVPGDRPADVYSAVADLVKENIAKDIEKGSPYATAVSGKITRKVVKQTVMTNVYGVTFIGAKKQVLRQLDAHYPNLTQESGIEAHLLASYIATKIFNALSTMFEGAHDIQYWLGEIGGRVCRTLLPEQIDNLDKILVADKPRASKLKTKLTKRDTEKDLLSNLRSTLIWTTPLRMPVVQPYRQSGTNKVQTCLQELILTVPNRTDPVNRRKQLQAFPPNFIHSLDASHMLLSALECDEAGLTFAAVHDSFWTHAADVDSMNNVIRDSFIRIHSEDVIGRLAAEFQARYKGGIYLAKVQQETPVGKKIRKHRRLHRRAFKQELLDERERQKLLASSDPEDQAKGQEMVTPASIFESMASAKDLAVASDEVIPKLGDIQTTRATKSAADGSEEAEENGEEMEAEAEAEVSGEEMEATEGGEDDPSLVPRQLDNCLDSATYFAKVMKGVAPKQKKRAQLEIWLPLTFPSIPKKGDFDVQQLKDSKYFFS